MVVMSKKFELIKDDLKKVGRGFLLALGGAVIAFLADVGNIIDYTQYGQYAQLVALVVASLSSSFINLIRKWMTFNAYPTE
jgi:hypothetical protein